MTQGLRKIAWFLGIAVTTGTGCAADLASDIARLAADPALAKVRVGYAVMDCDGAPGSMVAARNADQLFVPASNLKIITTGIALDVLGPDFKFETMLLLDATGGRARLTLVGSGDPALFHPEIAKLGLPRSWTTVQDAVNQWSDSLRRQNVRQVDELLVDARIFDGERLPADSQKWISNEPQGTYATGLWGVNMGGNAAVIDVYATAGRSPWVARIDPPFLSDIASNRANCAAGKAKIPFTLGVASTANRLSISMSGTAQPGSSSYATHIVNTPACVGAMLASMLTQSGVHVAGWRIAETRDAKASGTIVEPVLVTPISTVLIGANTESINICAEALAKRVAYAKTGAPGSWSDARSLIPALVAARLGSEATVPSGFAAWDGSGLDDRSRVSPTLLVAWMRSFMRSGAIAKPYFESFAVPAKSGTLLKRFGGASFDELRVFGKSGYIDGASCLSGVVVNTESRRAFAYSVLCNDTAKGAELSAARELQEKIVIAVANHLKKAPPLQASASADP